MLYSRHECLSCFGIGGRAHDVLDTVPQHVVRDDESDDGRFPVPRLTSLRMHRSPGSMDNVSNTICRDSSSVAAHGKIKFDHDPRGVFVFGETGFSSDPSEPVMSNDS